MSYTHHLLTRKTLDGHTLSVVWHETGDVTIGVLNDNGVDRCTVDASRLSSVSYQMSDVVAQDDKGCRLSLNSNSDVCMVVPVTSDTIRAIADALTEADDRNQNYIQE